MSTPHQGPGMYPQNDQQAALAWLASLDQNQQVALRRSIQTHQALRRRRCWSWGRSSTLWSAHRVRRIALLLHSS